MSADVPSDGNRITAWMDEEMLAELRAESERQERPLSWLMQMAWTLARKRIRAGESAPATVPRYTGTRRPPVAGEGRRAAAEASAEVRARMDAVLVAARAREAEKARAREERLAREAERSAKTRKRGASSSKGMVGVEIWRTLLAEGISVSSEWLAKQVGVSGACMYELLRRQPEWARAKEMRRNARDAAKQARIDAREEARALLEESRGLRLVGGKGR